MDEWPRSQPVPLWQRLLYAMVDLSPELADTPAIEFQSEEQFQQLLDRGPVMTALMVPGHPHCRQLRRAFTLAACQFADHAQFVKVDCAKHSGFCRLRHPKFLPKVELFVPERHAMPGEEVRVNVFEFENDWSLAGFREFLRRHGVMRPPAHGPFGSVYE